MDQSEAPKEKANTPHMQQNTCIGTDLGAVSWVFLFLFIELVWTFAGGYATWTGMRMLQGPIGTLVALHLNFLVLLAAVAIVSHMALHITVQTLATDNPRFRWDITMIVIVFWIGSMGIASALLGWINPGSISRSDGGLLQWLSASAAILVLTPLQCAAEELLMRAFLWRMLQRFQLAPLARNSISAGVFMLAHLANTEVTNSFDGILALAFYGLTGFLFMEMTARSGGIEAALGAHIGNNVFIAICVNYPGSSLPAPAWFIRSTMLPGFDILVLCTSSACILAWLGRYRPKLVNESGTRPCR